jgi:hypothetical protein
MNMHDQTVLPQLALSLLLTLRRGFSLAHQAFPFNAGPTPPGNSAPFSDKPIRKDAGI